MARRRGITFWPALILVIVSTSGCVFAPLIGPPLGYIRKHYSEGKKPREQTINAPDDSQGTTQYPDAPWSWTRQNCWFPNCGAVVALVRDKLGSQYVTHPSNSGYRSKKAGSSFTEYDFSEKQYSSTLSK